MRAVENPSAYPLQREVGGEKEEKYFLAPAMPSLRTPLSDVCTLGMEYNENRRGSVDAHICIDRPTMKTVECPQFFIPRFFAMPYSRGQWVNYD